jgi:phage FluMu protein Com
MITEDVNRLRTQLRNLLMNNNSDRYFSAKCPTCDVVSFVDADNCTHKDLSGALPLGYLEKAEEARKSGLIVRKECGLCQSNFADVSLSGCMHSPTFCSSCLMKLKWVELESESDGSDSD